MSKKRNTRKRPASHDVNVVPSEPSWSGFLQAIEEAKTQLAFEEDEECFYRGHGSMDYELLPTLLRDTKGWKTSRLWSLESDLFFEFQARARDLHGSAVSAWEILQFMRHHGVATRLLDWTEVFGVALYFAVHKATEASQPCIWLMNPYALNETERGERDLVAPRYLAYDEKKDVEWDYEDLLLESPGMGWDYPVALYPVQKSSRLHAQRGYFTIHGDRHETIDVLCPATVRCVPLATSLLKIAKQFLDYAGINEYLLFPDLDGLARGLHVKYKLEKKDRHPCGKEPEQP